MSELSDKDIAQQLRAQHKEQEVKKTNFPTEIIDLPSKGLLYPEEHPLATGKIEMKYMTAREEDILTSGNLIRQGVVIDKLLESLIVTPVKYSDLIVGDKNAIMIAARVLGYGKDYQVKVTCPKCSEESDLIDIDLTSFTNKEVDESNITKGKNEFHFRLPAAKRDITFKLLTHGDERAIDQEVKSFKKKISKTGIDNALTTRLSHIIQSVDGNQDKKFIRDFVQDELFALDSRSLRDYIKQVSPDIDTTFHFECDHCGHEVPDMTVPIGIDFFWPGA